MLIDRHNISKKQMLGPQNINTLVPSYFTLRDDDIPDWDFLTCLLKNVVDIGDICFQEEGKNPQKNSVTSLVFLEEILVDFIKLRRSAEIHRFNLYPWKKIL